MPTYVFSCGCGWYAQKFFKMLPSEDKQKSCVCEECGQTAGRDHGKENFYANGGQHSGMEKAVGFAMQRDDSGRPIYKDVNGKVQEVRTASDVDRWMSANSVGKPRLVEYTNPITGEKGMTPMRVGGVKLDPMTGEPMDKGAVIRDAEPLVPLDNDWSPPSESRTGNKLVNGVLKNDPGERPIGLADPETGKPMKMADCWGGAGEGIRAAPVPVKRPPSGKKWS